MSNRAPTALTVPVRRATAPSTASKASAAAHNDTRVSTGMGWANDDATSAATPPTRTARVKVTQSAGRGPSAPSHDRAAARPSELVSPQTAPMTTPATVTEPSTARLIKTTAWPRTPRRAPDRTVRTAPP